MALSDGGTFGVIFLAPWWAHRRKPVRSQPQRVGVSMRFGCPVYLAGWCVFGFGD
jgi:hypothetical protein